MILFLAHFSPKTYVTAIRDCLLPAGSYTVSSVNRWRAGTKHRPSHSTSPKHLEHLLVWCSAVHSGCGRCFFFVPFWAKGIPQPLLSGHEALNSEIFLFLQQRVHFYEKTIFPVMKSSLRICSVTAWNSLVVTFLDVWGPLVLFLIMLMETSYSCPGPRPDWRNWFLEDGRVLMTFPFSSFCKDT